jgi:hypothetical protein
MHLELPKLARLFCGRHILYDAFQEWQGSWGSFGGPAFQIRHVPEVLSALRTSFTHLQQLCMSVSAP